MKTASTGLNDSERKLKALADKTFLHYWSHSNLFNSAGCELCDLVVIFGRHVILFSDKTCAFDRLKERKVAWPRWYKKAVTNSVKQVLGAKRWIENNRQSIYFDAKAKEPFDRAFPEPDEIQFHLIVVASGIRDAAREFLGEPGALKIDYSITSDPPSFLTIGNPGGAKGFVHVFDEFSLEFILRSLDTITDFVDYIQEREAFCGSSARPRSRHELDLWALYLRGFNTQTNLRHFPSVRSPEPYQVPRAFEEVYCSAEYQGKIKADRDSFVWDYLIRAFTKPAEEGILEEGSQADRATIDPAFRELAIENRFARRMLGKAFREAAEIHFDDRLLCRITQSCATHTVYVFLFMRQEQGEDNQKYRRARTAFLAAYCIKAAEKFNHLGKVVGIAMCPKGSRQGCEDLFVIDFFDDMAVLQRHLEKLPEIGILESPCSSRIDGEEYPT